MAFGNTAIALGGVVAVVGVSWYLYSKGYFDSIVDALGGLIPKGGDGDGNGTPEPTPTPTPKPKCTAPKIECKDGKCNTQAKCDTQAKCKTGEHWNPTSKKCAKTTALAYAFVGQQGPFRAYVSSIY